MGIILNATNETISVKAHGNWFTFKPKQYKIMNDDLVAFLSAHRAEDGLVELPTDFEDPSHLKTPEGKEAFAKAEAEGVARYVAKLKETVNNCLISMKKDLQMKNIQTDPRAFMSDGEMKALEKLAEYQTAGKDEEQKRVDRARELEKKLRMDDESQK